MTTIAHDPAVIEKTVALCQTLVSQPGMLAIRQRIDSFMEDVAARADYDALMRSGRALHQKEHEGQSASPAEIAEFETQREKVLGNPVARGFLDAQEELHHLQETISQYVTKTLELGRVPTAEDLESGGCCGGGGHGGGGGGCGCSH